MDRDWIKRRRSRQRMQKRNGWKKGRKWKNWMESGRRGEGIEGRYRLWIVEEWKWKWR